MTTILVVDDSEVDRRLVGGLLQRETSYAVRFAHNGREALNDIRKLVPDLVLTDMNMPERDGLGLVNAVRLHYPHVPVILMTAHGSDDLAIEALEQGAASYVPKSQLNDKLVETIDEVLAISRADQTYEQLVGCLTRTEFTFALHNDAALIEPLVDLVQQIVAGMKLCDATGRFRVGVALKAALLNALYRGNLEISFEQMQQTRESLVAGTGVGLAELRREESPYKDRRIHVEILILNEEAKFVIRDEGPGFDVAKIPTTGGVAMLEPTGGRGLILMRSFMDSVQFNERGNEVTMTKRQETPGS